MAKRRASRVRLVHRFRGPLSNLFSVAVITLTLLLFKAWFDTTNPGKVVEEAAYTLLQTRLSDDGALQQVVVVDISESDPQNAQGDTTRLRGQLESVIDAIADQKPAAIGVDVDFSPEGNDWTPRGGPLLFKHILELEAKSQRLKIYLGVDRTRYKAPEDWLGVKNLSDRAATLALRKDENRRMPLWIGQGDTQVCWDEVKPLGFTAPGREPRDGTARGSCLLSMSAKLALQYLKVTGHDFAGKPGFWPHIISTVKPAKRLNPASPIRTASFLVDYGAVERLRGQTAIADVCGGDVKFFPRTDFRGKVVILGNTQWETTLDKYPIPPWQREVPGVYFHSSGVYTLIQGALREPTKPLGEVLFDVLAVMLVTALILGIERALHNRFSEERIRWLAIWIVVIAVAFWGYWMIRSTRILWTDWLWVCLALLIHGWMERHTKRHSRTLRGAFLHFLSGEGKESAA